MSVPQMSRKRGRPAKYASQEEKALVTAQRKKAKRQLQSSKRRAATYDQFYGTYQNLNPHPHITEIPW